MSLTSRKHTPVVGIVNHDGILGKTVLLQLLEKLTHICIHSFYRIVVMGIVFTDGGYIGVILRQLNILGRMGCVVHTTKGTTLMGTCHIDNLKKGLSLFELLPFELCRVPAIVIRPPSDVVIGLADI